MATDDDLPGAGGLGDLFAQFEKAQEMIQSAAAEASATVVEGSAADGGIVVQLTGDLDAVSVHIDPSLVDRDDVAMLEDLVLAAIRDGLAQIAELQEGMAGAFSGVAGGLDLGAMLGSLGNIPGLGDIGDLGSFEMGATAQLPGLEGVRGLAPGSSRLTGLTDDNAAADEDDAGEDGDDDPSGNDGTTVADDDDAGLPGLG